MKDMIEVRADIRSAEIWVEKVSEFLLDCAVSARRESVLGMPEGNIDLSVLLTGDAHIRRLNRDWRGKDTATDVLSFGADGDIPFPGGAHHLGDIVVSLLTARRQAGQTGRSLSEELRTLLVHGFLHLLGYDHKNDEDELVMERAAGSLGYPSKPELVAAK